MSTTILQRDDLDELHDRELADDAHREQVDRERELREFDELWPARPRG